MSEKKMTPHPSNNPKGRPKTSIRDDVSVKVARPLKLKAEAVARHRGITLAQVLTEAAEPAVNREYLKVIRELGDKP